MSHAHIAVPSANGATQASPGQRPGIPCHKTPQALKGRDKSRASVAVRVLYPAGWAAPSGLDSFSNAIPRALPFGPRALPWAIVGRAFGAEILRPKGANQASPGQRPELGFKQQMKALKGRPNA